MSNKQFQSIGYIVKGAVVGVGAILPGISGGVLCVAFGIYEILMELFTHPIKTIKEHYKLFIPFFIGWIIGFILLARVVEMFFGYCPSIALMLFFGLISGTIPELIKKSEMSDKNKSWTPFVLSVSLAYLFFHILENASVTEIPLSFGAYLFCGVLWGLSLVIPGLSSSTILIFLGLFEPLTAGIGSLDFGVIIPFLIGIGATALLLARLVSMLYKNHYSVISRVILGFMIASALKIVPNGFESLPVFLFSVLCFGVGFFIARKMDCAEGEIK